MPWGVDDLDRKAPKVPGLASGELRRDRRSPVEPLALDLLPFQRVAREAGAGGLAQAGRAAAVVRVLVGDDDLRQRRSAQVAQERGPGLRVSRVVPSRVDHNRRFGPYEDERVGRREAHERLTSDSQLMDSGFELQEMPPSTPSPGCRRWGGIVAEPRRPP